MKAKVYISILSIVMFLGLITSCGTSKGLTNNQVKARVDSLVALPKINFKVTQAIPTAYKSVMLSYGYNLKVNKDTVSCYLPYFGRAYVANYGNTEDSGIKFTSTNFEYSKELTKKGGYNITIKPKDTNKRYVLYLTVQSSGYATLQVTDPDRQPISFYGEIDY